jgi:hypothetical protein
MKLPLESQRMKILDCTLLDSMFRHRRITVTRLDGITLAIGRTNR